MSRATNAARHGWVDAMLVPSEPKREPRSFRPSEPWWVDFMAGDQQAVQAMIKEIEIEKGRMTAHERECAQRYRRIDEKLGEIPGQHAAINANIERAEAAMKAQIAQLAGELKTVSNGVTGGAWKANWKAWGVATFLFVTLLGALGWTAGQLYALEPLRVQQAAQVRAK